MKIPHEQSSLLPFNTQIDDFMPHHVLTICFTSVSISLHLIPHSHSGIADTVTFPSHITGFIRHFCIRLITSFLHRYGITGVQYYSITSLNNERTCPWRLSAPNSHECKCLAGSRCGMSVTLRILDGLGGSTSVTSLLNASAKLRSFRLRYLLSRRFRVQSS